MDHIQQEEDNNWKGDSEEATDKSLGKSSMHPVKTVDILNAVRCSKAHPSNEEESLRIAEGLIKANPILGVPKELLCAVFFRLLSVVKPYLRANPFVCLLHVVY